MAKKLSLILVLITAFALAQNRQADSLYSLSATASGDIEKVNLLNLAADAYKSTDPKLTAQYAAQAHELSRKLRHRTGQAEALLNLGNAAIIQGDYQNALKYFADARTLLEKESESASGNNAVDASLARAYGSIGIVFSEQSNYSRALQFHLKSARIYERIGDKHKLARVYNNIGIAYQSQHQDFKALDFFSKSLALQQKLSDPNIGITHTNIGNIYLRQKNPEQAWASYSRARSVFEKHPNPRGMGELFNNIALYHKQKKEYQKAVESCAQAIRHFETIGDRFGTSDSYAILGEVNFRQGDYAQAILNTERSLLLGKQLNIPERVRDSEKLLSDIYSKMNRPDLALAHFKLFSAANDSISNYENIRTGVRAEMNYEFEKKEALQRKEQEKRELVYAEKDKRHQLQIGFAVLLVIMLSGIAFLVNNRRNLKKTLTLEKELAEYEQKALHLQMNPHFVFNCLGSISSFIVQNGTDSAIKYLSKFSKLMRLTLEYSKESLIPIDKEIESLQNYLELEQLRFNQKFNFRITKGDDIEDDMAIPPLLLQPFVENAIIHGLIPKDGPGEISIGFSLDRHCLICTISDNGIGFNKSQELKENLVSVHKSMALDITRKRLEMMEAFTEKASKVEIKEVKDAEGRSTGTIVMLKLPVQYITK